MKAIKIELCFAKTEYGKSKFPRGCYTVNVGGFVKYFKTESGAHKFLESIGFKYNYDTGFYEKRHEGEQVNSLNNHFEIFKVQAK